MIEVVEGDITRLDVDAVVNAANSRLAGGGGVDGAIHRAAGQTELQKACRAIGHCGTGDAVITAGFGLPARWIIHAVGPVWHGGENGERELLASAYRRSFRRALEAGARSIAFPCISTGVYGFPKGEAARIAVRVMRTFESDFERIVACCFSQDDAELYRNVLS